MRIKAPWLRAAGTRAVLDCLADGGWQVYLVGGCVRNALLGRPVADLDIATDARPEEVIARAAACDLKAVPTGVEHGTVTLVSDHRPFEVTTFRRDVETFGRHATVAFSTNIAEDAARRDFTMNALYATPEGEVIDPMGGLPDLRARRLRFVGDPALRIAEDYLRILRFFRFHAWYGDPEGGIDAAALAACAEGQEGLDGLSRERVGAEITKLLAAPDPAPSVASMAATGILARVLPGAEAAALAPLVHIETLAGATDLPMILYDIPHRAGRPIEAGSLMRLAGHPNIVAVKDAKNDITGSAQVLAATDLDYFAGDDAKVLPLLAIGGVGVIGTSTVFTGRRTAELIDAWLAGNPDEALRIYRELLPVYTGVFATQGVMMVKAGLAHLGFDAGSVRAPLLPASADQAEHFAAILDQTDL